MKRCLIALIVAVLSLSTGVGLATAAVPPVETQTADQSASSGQLAGAAAGAAQTDPSNTNISIRVLSPGEGGSVSQTNSVESDADAENKNSSDQDATQTQSSGGTGACCPAGSTGVQTADQYAGNQQASAALSTATQWGASNTNVPIRVGSKGDDGSVSQTNSVDSDADAANRNSAEQDATQSQSSGGTEACCPSGSTGVQTADQDAENKQAAIAASSATQVHPKNTNVSIRVLSPGDDGRVSQTNSVESDADAKNSNSADQTVEQDQSSGGSTGACCKSGSTGVQTADQDAENKQIAAALSKAEQKDPSNTNVSIRVGSKGDNGSVWQTNSVESDAEATNRNSADQSIDQDQTGASGTGIQTADQDAESKQAAIAASSAEQKNPKNTNVSIRVLSPGDNGKVVQTNSVESDADAKNSNWTDQSVEQDQSGGTGSKNDKCCDSGLGVQTADQKAKNEQFALGLSFATQKDASNKNAPIRVGSKGDDGSVWQTNSVDSDADATNKNGTEQDITQTQSGGSCCPSKDGKDGKDGKHEEKDKCCHGSTGIQTAEQSAKSEQAAAALSAAIQKDASNKNTPLRVGSKGDDGKVVQTNSVESDADAKNSNWADQSVEQDQSGGTGSKNDKCCDSGLGVQTADQKAKNEQFALGLSLAKQEDASNKNAPIRVKSKGDGGSVWQTNSVDSDADATNKNGTEQDITQTQSGGSCCPSKDGKDGKDGKHEEKDKCCHGSTGIQTAEQSAKSEQAAAALSAAVQKDASNKNTPLRVLSKGDDGKVVQTNSVESDADAKNSNWTDQSVEQDQSAGHRTEKCGCKGGEGIQVADQSAKNEQFALGVSLAKQEDASNKNAPLRVKSKGDDGSVWQTNDVDSDAEATNKNGTEQDITQTQSGGSGSGSTGIQVADQSAKNEQAAAALSAAIQKDASNKNTPLRVNSKGDGGKVVQTNSVESDADAKNSNWTDQSVEQDQSGGSGSSKDKCCGSDLGIQVSGQEAKNEQLAIGLSAAIQKDASNKNAPLRVKSKGDDGSVWQTNSVDSDADASNKNRAEQDVTQTQRSGSGSEKDKCCHDGDLGIQVAAQSAKNHQAAAALSIAFQDGASNKNSPLRVLSKGDDGKVVQKNSVESDADAKNRNSADQSVTQEQSGGSSDKCGCKSGLGIQVSGQESKSAQAALVASFAVQQGGRSKCGCPSGASNENDPVRVLSRGSGGSVWQSNTVDSHAKGKNSNHADQDVTQTQSGSGAQTGIQVTGQAAKNHQLALVLSAALQKAPKNKNAPLAVGSKGHGGLTSQSNKADASGYGANRNRAGQSSLQRLM